MAIYRGVNGVNRKIKEICRGVNGVNRKIKEEWRGVNGVNRKVFSSFSEHWEFTREFFDIEVVESDQGTVNTEWKSNNILKVTFNKFQNTTTPPYAHIKVFSKKANIIKGGLYITCLIKRNPFVEPPAVNFDCIDNEWFLKSRSTLLRYNLKKGAHFAHNMKALVCEATFDEREYSNLILGLRYQTGIIIRLRDFGEYLFHVPNIEY